MVAKNKNLAFVFPGQGSQSLKMMSSLADENPEVLSLFQEASDVLGFDLWQLTQEGPLERLNQTEFTQPALLVASLAAWQVWCKQSIIRPQYLAGHSLGEYTALVAANVLDFKDAVQLVAARGKFMQEAVPAGQGAMAAILGLDIATVESACLDAANHQVVEAANLNAPGQIVIAGDTAAVERACTLLKKLGAKRALILPVSAPSHCALMQVAATRLEKMLDQVAMQAPEYELWHNVDVKVHTQPKDIKNALVSQLYKPVQWISTIEKLASLGVTDIVECGPGKVLAGLTKRIDKSLAQHHFATQSDLSLLIDTLNEVSQHEPL